MFCRILFKISGTHTYKPLDLKSFICIRNIAEVKSEAKDIYIYISLHSVCIIRKGLQSPGPNVPEQRSVGTLATYSTSQTTNLKLI